MNKDKIVVYSNYGIVISALIVGIILGFINNFSLTYYYMAIAFICGIALVNLLFMIVRLSVNKDYDFKKYTPAMHSSYLVVAVLSYYLIKNLKHYNEFWYLYWMLLILGSIICIVIFYILNKKDKGDNKPKIIANRR